MNTILRNALATKRIARLVVLDTILEDFREKLYEKYPPEDYKLSYLVTCVSCTSVWAGAAVASGLIPRQVVELLAYSEAAIMAGELVDAIGGKD